MVSAVEFRNALKRWTVQRVPEYGKAMQVAVAVDLGTRIVRKMPVRTGLARGNVRLGIGKAIARGILSRRDKFGATTIAALEAAAERLAPYSVFTIYNNVVYVPFLEKGSSRQAPLGMFRISLKEAVAARAQTVSAALRRVKGRFIVR